MMSDTRHTVRDRYSRQVRAIEKRAFSYSGNAIWYHDMRFVVLIELDQYAVLYIEVFAVFTFEVFHACFNSMIELLYIPRCFACALHDKFVSRYGSQSFVILSEAKNLIFFLILKQPAYLAVLDFHADGVGHFGQPRHEQHIARYRDDEARARAVLHVAHGNVEVLGTSELFGIV